MALVRSSTLHVSSHFTFIKDGNALMNWMISTVKESALRAFPSQKTALSEEHSRDNATGLQTCEKCVFSKIGCLTL